MASTSPARGSRNIPSRAAKIKKPARHTRSAAALLASPDEDHSLSDGVELVAVEQIPVNRKRSSRAASRTARKRMRGVNKSATSQSSRKQQTSAKDSSAPKQPALTYPGNDLPYHIWLRIFEYLASPLLDPSTSLTACQEIRRNILSLARCDRLFFEPALAALYKCPPIIFPDDFAALVKRLSLPPAEATFNYRPRIEVLRINVDSTLYRKHGGHYLDLKDVVRPLSRLKELELWHPFDLAPYRELSINVRWKYPEDLLEVFRKESGLETETRPEATWTQLQGWTWNGRLAGEAFSLDKLAVIHTNPCFAKLRKLTFKNYQLPSATRESQPDDALEVDLQAISQFAASIQALPDIEHLTIESSTIASGVLLMMLPKSLKHLELINCFEVTADDFAEFLESHGANLRRLTLSHCQSLNLDFLSVLAAACPHLTHLRVNLLYYQHHEAYRDSEPVYEALLSKGQIPTWPASLQNIDIDYMRFTETASAELFFQSLADSAQSLSQLRQLVLKAKLNVGWAERNEFRRTWEDRLVNVFLRSSRPPQRFTNQRPQKLPRPPSKRLIPEPCPGSRRSARISIPQSSPESPEMPTSRSIKGTSRVAVVTKELQGLLATRPQGPGHEADHEDNADDDDEHGLLMPRASNGTRGKKTQFVHGMCDVVDVQIDNQKPRENQFGMDDFLDSSQESDSEWNSHDE